MNKLEVGKLLLLASGFDNRKVDDLNTSAWLAVLHPYEFEAACNAVVAHQTGEHRHEYMTVAHIFDALQPTGGRTTIAEIEADVRSAKARRLLPKDWPEREPVPADVAEKLAAARAGARAVAEQYAIGDGHGEA